MSPLNSWQSGTTALIALAITTSATIPIFTVTPASAQYRDERYQNRVTIPTGTSIPVKYDQAEKIVVTPDETVPLTLTVATDVIASTGTVLIPEGSEVVGQLEPASRSESNNKKGSRFVAQELVFKSGRRQSMAASSRVIVTNETIRRGASTGSILTGAAVGGGAAALISGLTGNRKIGALEVIGGAGAGAVGGLLLGRKSVDVVVINPDTDLDLRLRSDLSLR